VALTNAAQSLAEQEDAAGRRLAAARQEGAVLQARLAGLQQEMARVALAQQEVAQLAAAVRHTGGREGGRGRYVVCCVRCLVIFTAVTHWLSSSALRVIWCVCLPAAGSKIRSCSSYLLLLRSYHCVPMYALAGLLGGGGGEVGGCGAAAPACTGAWS
jgi:hypothetical protein